MIRIIINPENIVLGEHIRQEEKKELSEFLNTRGVQIEFGSSKEDPNEAMREIRKDMEVLPFQIRHLVEEVTDRLYLDGTVEI